ncbi:MAG TPA: amidohydrolase family protein [Candidatus Eisenbacteria bacterium]
MLRGDLLAVDGVIVALGRDVEAALGALPGGRAAASYDATGALVFPGLVQGHLHLCQTLFRGLAEQSDLLGWLTERIWPLEAAHTETSIAASARLGLAELLAAGVTCVNDMGTVRHTEAIGTVLEEVGIRAIFGKALMDRGAGVPVSLLDSPSAALSESRALRERFHGAAGGRLQVALGPRFILSCSDALWDGVASESEAHGLPIHTHLAESAGEVRQTTAAVSGSAVRYFATRGLLTERFVGAHGVWLDPDELQLLKRMGGALIHCPGSNLKLGSGIASVSDWVDLGLKRGLGSDGAACNNRLDPFHELSLAAGLSRVRRPERPVAARDVVALATCEGARALGLGTVIGSLEPGKQADVVVVDVSGPHHGPDPEADPYTALVHAARAADVRLTLVAGRPLYRDGRFGTLDPRAAVAEARAEARGLARRAGLRAAA